MEDKYVHPGSVKSSNQLKGDTYAALPYSASMTDAGHNPNIKNTQMPPKLPGMPGKDVPDTMNIKAPAAGLPDAHVQVSSIKPPAAERPDVTAAVTQKTVNEIATAALNKEEASVMARVEKRSNPGGAYDAKACSYKQGELPPCAPLAAGFVPFQQKNPPKYATEDALTRGTLFPGLDLPFMNVTNKNNPYAGTPMGEMMAIGFAIHELVLYLDTHKDDKEAFDMLKSLIGLEREGRKEYVRRFGPMNTRDMENADSFKWLSEPWPWEYAERTGK